MGVERNEIGGGDDGQPSKAVTEHSLTKTLNIREPVVLRLSGLSAQNLGLSKGCEFVTVSQVYFCILTISSTLLLNGSSHPLTEVTFSHHPFHLALE